MRSFSNIILSSVPVVALVASPAYAQATAPVESTPEKTEEGEALPPSSEPTNAEGQAVRKHRRPMARSSSPVRASAATISRPAEHRRDHPRRSGSRRHSFDLRDPQSASITSGTSQVSGTSSVSCREAAQGANTVGLRGLGAARTLVLLNGRRLAPAGVGAQLVAADLNTLPTSVVQRIEVLREGASSIYGSDAIAGVINVITDTKINGITIDTYADVPEIGAGRTLRGSITAGKVFDRGHILASFEYRQDKGPEFGDRPDTRCHRERAFINGSQEVGQTVPFSTELRCYPYARGGAGIAAGYGLGCGFRIPGGAPPGPSRICSAGSQYP